MGEPFFKMHRGPSRILRIVIFTIYGFLLASATTCPSISLKNVSQHPVAYGGKSNGFSFMVSNRGNAALENYMIQMILPPGAIFESLTLTPHYKEKHSMEIKTMGESMVTWTLPSFPVHKIFVFTTKIKVDKCTPKHIEFDILGFPSGNDGCVVQTTIETTVKVRKSDFGE